MDKIYSQAYFTIIAAAGRDSRDGLAGVTTPRNQQEEPTQKNGIQFRYLGKPPRKKIRSTKWAERGWTYQEGFLSRRRIFFTDEQVIFQCNNMTCLESLCIPMKALHAHVGTKVGRVLDDIKPLDTRSQDIGHHIMEYSMRQLSNKEDSLNAFMGILSYFKAKYSWGHLLGNPIHPEKNHMIIAWYHPKPVARIDEFPSWSWTGWQGSLKLTSRDHPEYKLELATATGEMMCVEKYRKLCQQPEMKSFIQLTGKVTNVSFEFINWDSFKGHDTQNLENGIWAALPFTNDVMSYSLFYLDDESCEKEKNFYLPAIVLETGIHSQEKNTIILVLRESYGYYKRAGLIRMANVASSAAEDKGRADNAQPTMYKDASGCWSRRAPTCEIEKRVWLEAAKVKTIQVC
jgi:hypothetical protein